MTLLVLVSLFLNVSSAEARTATVAVIDTGIDHSVEHQCKDGHKTFFGTSLADDHGHGTHVAGLIEQYSGDADYCMISLKYYSEQNTGLQNLTYMSEALRHAIKLKVDYINISGGGPAEDTTERHLIKRALNMGIVVVVAAGNESADLDSACNYFPACYDKRIVVVGNNYIKLGAPTRAPSSNYGHYVKRWEIGTNVRSNVPSVIGKKYGYMSGTSQAAAIATGKLIKMKWHEMRSKREN